MSTTVRDKFDQLVDKFAVKVDDNEKKTLVRRYNLPMKYHASSAGECFKGLKMMGVFSLDKPEGLLDIADVLERPDLKNKFQGELASLKKRKLRESSTKIDLEQLYDSLAFDQSLEIAKKQVTVGAASTELLKQITKFRFKNDVNTKERILVHLRSAISKLEEATDQIQLAGEEALSSTTAPLTPIQERRDDDEATYDTVTISTPPIPETTGQPSLYENVGKHGGLKQEIITLSPRAGDTKRKGMESPARKKGPPPPPKPKKTQKENDDFFEYDVPEVRDYTGSGSADSGIGRGEWPLPQVSDKSHQYQRLEMATLETEREYSDVSSLSASDPRPTPPPKPKNRMHH